MSPNSSIARALAAFNGKDDPLKVENDRLTARVTELETAAQQQTELFTAAATSNESLSNELAELRTKLEAAETAKTQAETAKAEAETRASAAETKASQADADAKSQIEAKEKEVSARANRMALDQMAKAGQPPPGSNTQSKENSPPPGVPVAMNPDDALRLMSSLSQ